MNSKVIRYGLLAGALLVWSLIFYKVFAALGAEEPVRFPNASPIATVDPSIPIDTFSLLANYPDPFLPLESEGNVTIDSTRPSTIALPAASVSIGSVAPIPVDLGFIRYMGMIANPESKNKAAVVNIKGRELLLKENESAEDVVLKKIGPDKITIQFQGKRFEILKIN